MNSEVMSSAAQVIIAITPIVGIAIGGIVLFFVILWKHRENSLMIKTGNYHPKNFNLRLFSLLAGMLLIGVGFVLTLLFSLLEGLSYSLLGGLIPFILGVCLIIFYKVGSKTFYNENK